jgi:hypothetical protein
MAEDESWKCYLTPEAARRASYEELAAEREQWLAYETCRLPILERIAELSAQIAAARECKEADLVEQLREQRQAAYAELRRLDEKG